MENFIMNMEKDKKVKRIRRTNYEIDKNITAAMEKLVAERGFSKLTLAAVAQEAKVEPPVIYNKYGGLEGLLEAFAKRYEYWLNDIFDKILSDYNKGNYEVFISKLFVNIAKKLYKDRVMQQLLAWEVQELNHITGNSAVVRESNSYLISKTLGDHFREKCGEDFNAFSAIIVSGIYYLILHKETSTFAAIDFNTKEGENRLIAIVEKLCSVFFGLLEPENVQIAAKMKKKDIDIKTIAECTGLTVEQINKLK